MMENNITGVDGTFVIPLVVQLLLFLLLILVCAILNCRIEKYRSDRFREQLHQRERSI